MACFCISGEQDIIHRDLKPANIIRKKDGRCIIVDFGLSKDTTSALGTATSSGAFKGTPAYSAPEVSLGSQEVTKATDVFALGVIFYEVNCFKNMPCQHNLKMPFPFVNIIATHWFIDWKCSMVLSHL